MKVYDLGIVTEAAGLNKASGSNFSPFVGVLASRTSYDATAVPPPLQQDVLAVAGRFLDKTIQSASRMGLVPGTRKQLSEGQVLETT